MGSYMNRRTEGSYSCSRVEGSELRMIFFRRYLPVAELSKERVLFLSRPSSVDFESRARSLFEK